MIYVDMDGVIANWTGAVCTRLNIACASNQVLEPYKLKHIASEELARLHHVRSFWTDMGLYPWAKELIQIVNEADTSWRFLTRGASGHESFTGKSIWIEKHFPEHAQRLVVCRGSKSFACKRGDVLIDDHPGNIKEWNRAGGYGFLWYEMTADYAHPETQLRQVAIFLREFHDKKI